MSFTLQQSGNNSITYSFVVDGAKNYLDAADWTALPPSRIRSLLLQTYAGDAVEKATALTEALAQNGFGAVVNVTFSVIDGEVPPPGGAFFPNIALNAGQLAIAPYYIDSLFSYLGSQGVLRISLAYSASE